MTQIDMEQMLCTEIFAIQRRFDVYLPFLTDVEAWLNRRYSTEVLEAHFGLPFVMPPMHIVDIYTSKSLFAEWMVNKGLAPFTPTVYSSKWEVAYPCLLKFTYGWFVRSYCG